MRKSLLIALGVVCSATLALTAMSQEQRCPLSDIINVKGESVGKVSLTETPKGVLVRAYLHNLPEGWHAFHIHETGLCTPPDFKSAGGHFNPEKKIHGYGNPTGHHAGDLPNIYIAKDGTGQVEYLDPSVTLAEGPASLFDQDGSALVIHEKSDDYMTDPTGAAGGRIACGVLKKP
jgi:Cu-Zn family superoxide dismutase